MIRHNARTAHIALVCFVVLVVGGGGIAAIVSGSPSGADETVRPSLERDDEKPNETSSPVELTIDCNRTQINATAPPDERYRITFTVVNLTSTTSSTTQSTIGPVTGNTTVDVDQSGAVFAFAMNESESSQPLTHAIAFCDEREESDDEAGTRERTDESLSVYVNCTTETVEFTGPDHTQYVASVTVVDVSPTQSATNRQVQTVTGNATVPIEAEGDVIAAFTSQESHDGSTASTIRYCDPPSQNETNVSTVPRTRSSGT